MSGDEVKEEGWQLIEDQAGLDSLDGTVNWDDADPVAFVGDTVPSNVLFPVDVARSGHLNANIRVLFFVADRRGSHLELVFVDCDEIGPHLFRGLTLTGHVDSLKRVDVAGSGGERILRCSRLMYRFIDVDQTEARQFYGFERAPRRGDAG
jgi:hypothetical protein